MRQRIFSAIIIIAVLIPILLLSHTIVLNFVVAIISVWSICEVLLVSKYTENRALTAVSIIFAAAVPFLANNSLDMIIGLIFLYVVALFIILIVKHKTFKFEHISVVFMMSVIIPFFLTCMIFCRRLPYGDIYFYMIFVGAWISDCFALLTGMAIGRNKLAPMISPKKTVEGAVGGLVFNVIAFIILGVLVQKFTQLHADFPVLIFTGALSAVAGQLGDLSCSLIKRIFSVKDFGSVLPGHGGILDRFDSILFVAPLIFIISQRFVLFY